MGYGILGNVLKVGVSVLGMCSFGGHKGQGLWLES